MKTHTKTIYVIDTHSLVDVITNSSSEIFVCNTDKSLMMVEELLKMMLEVWKLAVEGQEYYSKETLENQYSYEQVFHVYVYTKERHEKAMNSQWGSDDYEKEENIGKIIISSASDNSIPYALNQLVEDAFNSRKYRL